MIGYLTGKLIDKKPTRIVLDVNGVGYVLNISVNTFEDISEEKATVSLYTHLAVKEDALDLYGFSSIAEKEMFTLLISINGIGPKLAQGVLSGIRIDELKQAFRSGNVSRLVAIPGIGKKTAERMMLELRDKVDNIEEVPGQTESGSHIARHDAVSALVNLGFNKKTAEKAVQKAADGNPEASIEDLIKGSLAALNK